MDSHLCRSYAAAGFFLKFRPGRGKSLNLDFQKPVASECPGCLPWRSRCYLAPSLSMLRRPDFTVFDLVVGPSWQLPSCSSWAAVAAEEISCRTPRDCEFRMPRGSHMVLEVGVLVPESVRHVSGFTGTITELPSQSQPPTFQHHGCRRSERPSIVSIPKSRFSTPRDCDLG